MAQDPVCHMDVDVDRPHETGVYKGKTYHFCSEGCRDRFLEKPELFISETKEKGNRCIACQTEVREGLYIKDKGPYCCEKCYFRDRFLGDAIDKVEGIYLATIEAFVEAIDAREHEVGSHSYRVTQFAMVLARKLEITGRDLVDIYCGALLHDVGKIGIPDSILLKQGKLTDEEFKVMSRHPEIGHRIISHIGYLHNAAEIIHSHHEHYDGSGYPRGLKGREIHSGARIFSVCDTLDALTVDRTYRKAVPYEVAKEHILSASGSLFDPLVVKGLLDAEDELKEFTGKILF
jgi:HD-GYP domain-containing protein (c-di-GMP phosphodiesterase class II)